MTNQEINHALALAIGWPEHDICLRYDVCYVHVSTASLEWPSEWRIFDYKDPAVIWPIAATFVLFPFLLFNGKWVVAHGSMGNDTPEKAVALAVIDIRDR